MVALEQPHQTPVPVLAVPQQVRRRRVPVPLGERIVRQVQGIDAWNAARRVREAELATTCTSRLDREAASRRSAVLRRTQQAIAARAASELARPAVPMVFAARTAVIAHGHTSFADQVAALLGDQGVTVVGCTGDGAEALGAVVAEQPDLVLAGEPLTVLRCEELLAEVRRFAPCTLRAVQTADPAQAEAWRAEVDAVFLRHHAPLDVAATLGALVLGSRAGAR